MSVQPQSSGIVLQGEFTIFNQDDGDLPIKTPIRTSCTVLTLYDNELKIGVLAHIDDYTSVTDVISQIRGMILGKYNVDGQLVRLTETDPLLEEEFQTAKVKAAKGYGIRLYTIRSENAFLP